MPELNSKCWPPAPEGRRSFSTNTDGNIAVTMAVMITAIMIAVGAATDFTRAVQTKTVLQDVLDQTVLAVVVSGETEFDVQKEYANNIFQQNWPDSNTGPVPVSELSVSGNEFTLTATKPISNVFGGFLGKPETNVTAVSVAVAARSSGDPCILALNRTARKTLDLTGGSSISAPNCGVFVNSSDSEAVNLTGGATISADITCVEGGIKALAENITPPADFTCGVTPDPMANFQPPAFSGCDYTDFESSGGLTVALWPGVYCGGIKLTGGTRAFFRPGTYVLKDGWLETTGGGDFEGEGVTFYVTGTDSKIELSGGAVINLSAPTTGPFAGVLFYQDPNSSPGLTSKLSGGGELYFEGVVYFPTQELNVSGGGTTSNTSPFTWYIADSFLYSGGSTLVINSDSAASSVPMPDGVALNTVAHLAL